MKQISLILILALALLPSTSFACQSGQPPFVSQQCPGPSGPCGCSYYDFYSTCPISSSNLGTATMSCYSLAGDTFASTGGLSVVYSMTVPTGHGGSCKNVGLYVDFTPTGNSSDFVAAVVDVYRSGSWIYRQQFLVHYGNQSSMSCTLVNSTNFSAQDGDEIRVTYSGYKASSNFSAILRPPMVAD